MGVKDKRIIDHLLGPMGLEEVGKDTYYGVFRGYQVNVCLTRRNPRYRFFASISSSFDEISAKKAIDLLKEGKDPRIVYLFDYFSCSVYGKGNTYEDFVNVFLPALERAAHAMDAIGCVGFDYCPISKQLLGEDARLVDIPPLRLKLSPDGMRQYRERLKSYKDSYRDYPSRPILGFLGALLAAVITFGIHFGILYGISFAAFVPLFGIVLSERLYTSFSKKPVLSCLPLITILTFVASFSAIAIVYANWASSAFPEATNIEAFRLAFSNAQFTISFVLEVGVSFVDLCFGSFFVYRRLKSRISFPPDIREIDEKK